MTARPRFELTRVYEDGTKDAPEIIPVGRMPWDTGMDRRGFLGVGVGVASVLLLLDGKATAQNTSGQQPSASSANQSSTAPVKVPNEYLKAHKSVVYTLAISPDRKTLASGSSDFCLKLWSLPHGKLLATLEGHKEQVRAAAISPDGKTLASGSDDGIVKLWSLPDGKLLATLEGHKYSVNALAISPDGKTLASGSGDHTVKLRSLADGKLLGILEEQKSFVRAIAISPGGKTLASGSEDGTVKLWSLPDGKLLGTLEGHRGMVRAIAISPDGKTLTSGSSDYGIKLWSLPDGKLLATLEGHKNWVYAIAISPHGKTLVSGSSDHSINLWSLPDGKLLATLEGHRASVNALAIGPDGEILASGDDYGVIILWDLEKRSFRTFLFDPKASETDAIAYNVYDKITGQTATYTLPCGSPIPPGAVCTCNCVPGTYRPASSGGGGRTVCTCDKVCTCIPVPSDRNVKEAFAATDPMTILQRLAELPIQTWNYNWDVASIHHIGPMAQDFAAAFAVGEDDKHIHPVDAQGVAFAAIQGLYRIIKENQANAESLQAQLDKQQEESAALRARIEGLEQLVNDPLSKQG